MGAIPFSYCHLSGTLRGTGGIIMVFYLPCLARSSCGLFLGALSNCETNYVPCVLHDNNFLLVFIKHQWHEFRNFFIPCGGGRGNRVKVAITKWQSQNSNVKTAFFAWPAKVLNRLFVWITWCLKCTPRIMRVQTLIPISLNTCKLSRCWINTSWIH